MKFIDENDVKLYLNKTLR